jgi:HAE1 family hydrophobic/amphiphilic exporter-1
VSIAALITTSIPFAALAQEGVIPREQRLAQQQPQQPTPSPTPPTPQRPDPARPDPQRDRQRQEQTGETRPQNPTEQERRNLPPTGEAPATPTQPGAQPQDPQTSSTITQPLQLSPEVSRERVGIIPGQTELMTLQEAIALALKNNLDIEAFREGVAISQQNLYSLRGVYDIVSGADINYRSQTFPVASIFAGGGEGSSITQRVFTYNFTTDQLIERTGGSWAVDFTNNRTNTSSTAATLTTQYNPTLTFTFRQPILRNFKIDQNRRLIRIAQRSLDLSDSQFRQRVIEIINQVQRAYWDLVFAIDNEKIARENVEVTRVQLDNNQKMVEAGTLAPIELRSTEAALESRKGDVITALQNITNAENVLKNLILKESADKIWASEIKPVDEPQLGQVTFNLDEATVLALKNRPELEQMRLQTEQKEIDIDFFKNQTKPQLDFVGFYTNTGLAGTPSDVLSGGNGFDSLTQGLIDNLNLLLREHNNPPFNPPHNHPLFNPTPPAQRRLGDGVPDRFRGGYLQSLKNLFGQDFKTYQIGVSISFPWRNRTAEGNLGRALAESRQLDARHRQLMQSVQVDVRNALQAVQASRQRYDAAQAARIAANAQLQGELERFRAGLSTNFFVLQRQTDLAIAQGNEVRAKTDYVKALADLQRVTGTTLVSNNVQVTSLVSNGK